MVRLAPTKLLCIYAQKKLVECHANTISEIEIQHKRHTAYCRKSQARKRPRSCRACNQAKIKCSHSAPCHQCTRKGLKCIFDHQQGRKEASENVVTTPVHETVAAAATSVDSVAGLVDFGVEGSSDELGDELIQNTDQTVEHEFEALPRTYSSSQDGTCSTDAVDLGEIFDENFLSTNTTTLAGQDSLMTLFDDHSRDPTTKDIISNINFWPDGLSGKELQLPTFSPASPLGTLSKAIGTSPSSEIVTPSHFAKNLVKTSLQQIHATMIIDMIYAYPRMMTRRETFPPFIHAYSPVIDTVEDQYSLPEHLAHCMGIAQLFVARNDDTRSFVWSTIRAEMRSFRDSLPSFDRYEAMSALQASLLYVIMRAAEDVPQDPKDDYELLVIYNVSLISPRT